MEYNKEEDNKTGHNRGEGPGEDEFDEDNLDFNTLRELSVLYGSHLSRYDYYKVFGHWPEDKNEEDYE